MYCCGVPLNDCWCKGFISNLESFPESGNVADYLGIVCVSKTHKQCLPTFFPNMVCLTYFCKPPILMAVRKIEQMYSFPAWLNPIP